MSSEDSNAKYRRHVLRARSANNHFTFCRDYVTKLKLEKTVALFLQDLINLASMDKTIRDEEDYFLCTVGYLETSLNWDDSTQSRMIKKLRELKYLEYKKVGIPTVRWLRIDIQKVEEDLDEAIRKASTQNECTRQVVSSTQNESTQNESLRKRQEEKKESIKEENTLSRVDASSQASPSTQPNRLTGSENESKQCLGDESSHEPKDTSTNTKQKNTNLLGIDTSLKFHQWCAEQLFRILNKHRVIIRKYSMKGWSYHFLDLMKQKDMTEGRIRLALQFHEEYYQDQHWPKKNCARTFCDDFTKIEQAIERYSKDPFDDDEENQEEREPVEIPNEDGSISVRYL